MKRLFLILISLWTLSALQAQTNDLPRSTPEAEGVPSRALEAFFDSLMALPQVDIHGIVVMRHGKVIGEIYPEPFAPEYRHTTFSVSKTFVGAAVGLAIADNRLRVTDRVAAFFPEQLPDSVSGALAGMTVHHLLTMTSGIKPDWALRNKRPDWIRGFLSKPVVAPGEKFQYDSMVTYMLSAIVQRVTGRTVMDYLQERIFTPMNVTEVAWEESPEGINTGGWGLHIQNEGLAKFGQLLLNRGKWGDRQLLPAGWVDQMFAKHAVTGREDYGYQTWLCDYPGAFRADGALGQFVIVIPEKEMVVVYTEASLTNGKPQRNLLWHGLLPQVVDQPLPVDKAYKRLQKKQAAYRLPYAEGKARSPLTATLAGKTIRLGANSYGWSTFMLQFGKKEVTLRVTDKSGAAYDLPFGHKQWLKTSTEVHPPYTLTPLDRFRGLEGPYWVAGSYGWPDKNTLQLKAHYVNWVTGLTLSLRQEENGSLSLTVANNCLKKAATIQATIE